MKYFSYLLLLSLISLSCQLFKKGKLQVKEQSQQENLRLFKTKISSTRQEQQILIDSSSHNYRLMIWPKGNFTYSTTDGFKGEAEKLIITGRQKERHTVRSAIESVKDSSASQTDYKSEKQSQTRVKKDKFSWGNSWTSIGVILLLYVGYRVYRKFIR